MPDKKKKPTHTRKDEYDSLIDLIQDNIPFADIELGFTNRFYFDASVMREIAEKEFPRMNMRLMLGDKPNAFERIGLELFISLFNQQTGIWLNDSSTYKHLIKSPEKK